MPRLPVPQRLLKRFRLRHAFVLAVLAFALQSLPAAAIEYRVEVVIFEHVNGGSAGSRGVWYPAPRRALTLDSSAASSAGFVTYSDAKDLADEAERMAASGRYRVLRHLAWQQPGLDERNARAIRVTLGSQVPLWIGSDNEDAPFVPASFAPQPGRSAQVSSFTVNGTLRVRLGRFLHLESQLVFTDPEDRRSYRLSESRKMRSRELHYIDNPRFGILTRIVPVEGSEDDTASALPEDADLDGFPDDALDNDVTDLTDDASADSAVSG